MHWMVAACPQSVHQSCLSPFPLGRLAAQLVRHQCIRLTPLSVRWTYVTAGRCISYARNSSVSLIV